MTAGCFLWPWYELGLLLENEIPVKQGLTVKFGCF